MLDFAGIACAVLIGVIIYFFAGSSYLFLMLIFLLLSIAVTKYGYWEKKEAGLYEYDRGWKNVASNGLFPTIFAVLSPFFQWPIFASSIAAITSDKFASEIGVMDKSPYDLSGLLKAKKTRAGKSGAVSLLGTLASLAGAAAIGLSAHFIFSANAEQMVAITIAGFIGNMADSIAGIFEEKGLGTKETSNMVCALIGGILGGIL